MWSKMTDNFLHTGKQYVNVTKAELPKSNFDSTQWHNQSSATYFVLNPVIASVVRGLTELWKWRLKLWMSTLTCLCFRRLVNREALIYLLYLPHLQKELWGSQFFNKKIREASKTLNYVPRTQKTGHCCHLFFLTGSLKLSQDHGQTPQWNLHLKKKKNYLTRQLLTAKFLAPQMNPCSFWQQGASFFLFYCMLI